MYILIYTRQEVLHSTIMQGMEAVDKNLSQKVAVLEVEREREIKSMNLVLFGVIEVFDICKVRQYLQVKSVIVTLRKTRNRTKESEFKKKIVLGWDENDEDNHFTH